MEPIDLLRQQHPWPDTKPPTPIPANKHNGWLNPSTEAMLKRLSAQSRLIVELGTWTGKSARFLLDNNPHAMVIGIDHFTGSVEHQDDHHADILPVLHQTCMHRCWEYRDRLTLVNAKTVAGMYTVHNVGLAPTLIYIDASHEYPDVARDIHVAAEFWPYADVCGDDYERDGVQRAVGEAAERLGRPLWHDDRAWSIL